MTFHETIHNRDIWLRGFHLSLAADMEYALMDLICTCLANSANEREDFKVSFFENVSFARKITLCKRILETHYPDDYKLHIDLFDKFKEIRDNRNLFAHAQISGDGNEKDDSFLYFEYIKDGQQKKDKVVFADLQQKLEGYKPYIDRLLLLVVVIYNKKQLK